MTKDHYAHITQGGKLYSGITCSLGEATTRADILSWPLEEGDVVFLCTDGLSNETTDEKLSEHIRTGETPERIVEIMSAEYGGKTSDNCTFVVYKHDGKDAHSWQHKPDWDRLRNVLKPWTMKELLCKPRLLWRISLQRLEQVLQGTP